MCVGVAGANNNRRGGAAMSSASEQSAVGAAAAAPAAAASAAASWPGSGEIGPGARMFHALINLVPASEARQIAATQDRM